MFGLIEIMSKEPFRESIECLDCGRNFQILTTRHLPYVHGTNSQDYRREHSLSEDTPLHSSRYSAMRRRLALRPENISRLKQNAEESAREPKTLQRLRMLAFQNTQE